MREHHHLSNAPIREALIDIIIEFPKELDRTTQLNLLQSLRDQVSKDYPSVQNLNEAQFEVNLQQKQGRFEGNTLGFRCFNLEKTRAVQFRRDGFTFNWLRPYSQWDDFRNVSAEMWKLYSHTIKPMKIVRLGVRYINDLALPAPFESFGEYLVSEPVIPAGLPQGLSRFLTQVTIEDDEGKASATVTHAFEGTVDPHFVNVILDIETRIQADFDPGDPAIWARLDYLRSLKNRVFFESLTEKALRLFA